MGGLATWIFLSVKDKHMKMSGSIALFTTGIDFEFGGENFNAWQANN